MREVDLRLMARHRLVADHGLGGRAQVPDILFQLRNPAGIASGLALGQQSNGAQPREGVESRVDDRLERIEFRRRSRARPVPRADGLDGLVQQPSFDPAVHRRSADAGATRSLSPIAFGLVE